ncbi:hypothetical protein [Microvirgula aerodenitrificans]|uniref:hypothetical protein n=1 Tax=Microvirgula aerodenitrificans TaxID=57480 RepID=UPI002F41A1A0
MVGDQQRIGRNQLRLVADDADLDTGQPQQAPRPVATGVSAAGAIQFAVAEGNQAEAGHQVAEQAGDAPQAAGEGKTVVHDAENTCNWL